MIVQLTERLRLSPKLAEQHSVNTNGAAGENSGKTAALKLGFQMSSGEIVIVQDADREYDPTEIPAVILPILRDELMLCMASRFLVRRATRVLYFYHYLANKFLTFFSNLFTNLNMTDIETGYKAFRGDIIRSMVIVSTRFGFEVEVTAKAREIEAWQSMKCR